MKYAFFYALLCFFFYQTKNDESRLEPISTEYNNIQLSSLVGTYTYTKVKDKISEPNPNAMVAITKYKKDDNSINPNLNDISYLIQKYN